MTGRISIPALRVWAANPVTPAIVAMPVDTALALVEAAEAARRFANADELDPELLTEMQVALARFDFGEGQ